MIWQAACRTGEQPDADSFAGKLQAAGYRPECVIRGIGEYPAVREVYLTHLRQVTKKLFCDLTTENRPGILYGIGVGSGRSETYDHTGIGNDSQL